MPSTTSEDYFSALAPDARRVAFERRAEKSLAAYFACPAADRTTTAHKTLATLLATLAPHHRAALAMHHTPRTWPDALVGVCRKETSLAIRLYCADHPTVGPAADVEAAAAEKLVAALSANGMHVVDRLYLRARDHFLSAEAAVLEAFEAHRSADR